MISGSNLYDFVQCPHRVVLDKFGNVDERDEVNPFVELLWKQGVSHEREIVGILGIVTDLTQISSDRRAQATLDAMQRGDELIYGGLIESADLIGIPDLLARRVGG